jgi:predicted pyridoxine 5'-phosphate oxidase superfamily flavin-nucleotide-binding protein
MARPTVAARLKVVIITVTVGLAGPDEVCSSMRALPQLLLPGLLPKQASACKIRAVFFAWNSTFPPKLKF